MSKEAIKTIETLKTKMNVSTESEVIRNAISLLNTVEEARDTSGNLEREVKNYGKKGM